LRNTQGERQRAKELKELEKSRDLLAKWLNHEYNGQIYNIPVHLRISRDGKLIETTKGAKVENSLALRLLEKLRKGTDVKGEKINGFTVIENTLDHVKIGCHTISWPIINQIF
jgi:predicted MPP superfamily phosphohydrolase